MTEKIHQSECIVCGGRMMPYFEKKAGERVTYHYTRCTKCGIVLNDTVYGMDKASFLNLNDSHKEYQRTDYNVYDPRWIPRLMAQADTISELFSRGILRKPALDWGAGDGKLAEYVNARLQGGARLASGVPARLLSRYDKYMKPEDAEGYLDENGLVKGEFGFVVSCSVFEHLRGRDDIDSILDLVSDYGILAVHTLICEEVPDDPEWFYIEPPVHCTIWTNSAMSELYRQEGYKGCAYHVESQMWFFFKQMSDYSRFEKNKDDISGTWVTRRGFVDYWKKKPYR